MKRLKLLIFILIITVTLMGGVIASHAEEPTTSEIQSEAMTSEAIEETEGIAEAESAVTAETESATKETIDYEEYAEKFVDYVFSGAAGSSEIMDKMIEIGSQYLEAKEQGFTFQERMTQLLTPDNIMATAAATFLVVIGIAFFIFRRTQTASSRLTTAEITRLGKLYEEEVNSNKDLREYIRNQNEVISKLNETVTNLSKKSDLTKTDMEHVNKLALATATMVKDVFMNSKTIDSSGKNLLLHDYTKALEESEKFGAVANEDK